MTGAASGIGRATSIGFAQQGCTKLALLDLNEAGLEETKSKVTAVLEDKDADILVIKTDVSSEDSVAAAFSSIRSHFKRIDYSVQCAGIGSPGLDSASCSLELFDRQHAVNMRGVWLCAREAIRTMREQTLDAEAYQGSDIAPHRAQRGSIVNVASTLAVSALAVTAPYCAAKGGVLALSRADAIDCIKHRIRVNCVMPGLVDSPMTTPDAEARRYMEENVLPKVPYGRWGSPEEVGDVCVFLTGNRASFVTGQAWAADGGLTAGAI